MTNPPLLQLPRKRDREKERERKKYVFSFANLAEFQHPWGRKQMTHKNRDITEGC